MIGVCALWRMLRPFAGADGDVSCALLPVACLPAQMDPPPRFTISADMVDMMRREGIAGLFTPEVLLRWALVGAQVAGRQGCMRCTCGSETLRAILRWISPLRPRLQLRAR